MAKKIIVKISATDEDIIGQEFLKQITKEFCFFYISFTKSETFLRSVCAVCGHAYDKDEAFLRFIIYANDQYYHLDKNASMKKIFAYIGCQDSISIKYVIGIPGGAGIETENGIHYFYHTKERGHLPHIHARYQGEEISIEILTLKVRGQFKNKKKQNEAINYVWKNKEELLEEYRKKTNGIYVWEYYVENDEIIPIER